jgi:hypothetical protein
MVVLFMFGFLLHHDIVNNVIFAYCFLGSEITQDGISDYLRQVGYTFLDRHVTVPFHDIIQQRLDHFVVVRQAEMPLHNPGPFLEPNVDGEGILFAMSARDLDVVSPQIPINHLFQIKELLAIIRAQFFQQGFLIDG